MAKKLNPATNRPDAGSATNKPKPAMFAPGAIGPARPVARPGTGSSTNKPQLARPPRPGRPGGTPKPLTPGKPIPPMVMNPDSALLAKLPVTQSHLNSIKKHYGIKG